MTEKRKITMNMDELTFGELEEFELATGLILSDAIKEEIVRDENGRPVPDPDDEKGHPLKIIKMGTRAMMGMIYLSVKRDDPTTTFDDIRRMKLGDIDFEMEEPISAADKKSVDPTSQEELSSTLPE